jgi:hypothetical protein
MLRVRPMTQPRQSARFGNKNRNTQWKAALVPLGWDL